MDSKNVAPTYMLVVSTPCECARLTSTQHRVARLPTKSEPPATAAAFGAPREAPSSPLKPTRRGPSPLRARWISLISSIRGEPALVVYYLSRRRSTECEDTAIGHVKLDRTSPRTQRPRRIPKGSITSVLTYRVIDPGACGIAMTAEYVVLSALGMNGSLGGPEALCAQESAGTAVKTARFHRPRRRRRHVFKAKRTYAPIARWGRSALDRPITRYLWAYCDEETSHKLSPWLLSLRSHASAARARAHCNSSLRELD